jgi:Kinetochore complex Fta4 of Sim4 subunit, or CENP-50
MLYTGASCLRTTCRPIRVQLQLLKTLISLKPSMCRQSLPGASLYDLLTASRTIKSLPQDYNDLYIRPDAYSNFPESEAARYKTIYDRLKSLAERRDQQQQRLARYKELQTLLEPFTNAQENIQPNLVTRDGELGKELEKMRILLARVTGRVMEVKERGMIRRSEKATAVSNQQKLAAVMDLT